MIIIESFFVGLVILMLFVFIKSIFVFASHSTNKEEYLKNKLNNYIQKVDLNEKTKQKLYARVNDIVENVISTSESYNLSVSDEFSFLNSIIEFCFALVSSKDFKRWYKKARRNITSNRYIKSHAWVYAYNLFPLLEEEENSFNYAVKYLRKYPRTYKIIYPHLKSIIHEAFKSYALFDYYFTDYNKFLEAIIFGFKFKPSSFSNEDNDEMMNIPCPVEPEIWDAVFNFVHYYITFKNIK